MALDIEGTAPDDGENDDADFIAWLKQKNVRQDMREKLINGGIDSMDVLKAVQNENIDELSKQLQLSIPEKGKLRVLFHQIPYDDLEVTSDKAEREAIKNMTDKLKEIQNSMINIQNSKKNLNDEVLGCKNRINKTIDDVISMLNKRREVLLQELNKLSTKKINELEAKHKLMNNNSQNAKKVIGECTNMIRKPINLNDVDERKDNILKLAQNVYDMDILNENDPIIRNLKMNVYFDSDAMSQFVKQYGNVCDVPIPKILSLTDNKDMTVNVMYELYDDEKDDVKEKKLKIEWNEIESKENEYDDDIKEEFKCSQEIVMKNTKNSTLAVKMKQDKTAMYAFRLNYFNGYRWSSGSGVKCIKVKKIDVDKWDTDNVGSGVTINGNTVTFGGSYRSAFLTNVVSTGIHIWTFKVVGVRNGLDVVGIWKTKLGVPPANTYWTDTKHTGYGYYIQRGKKTKPESAGDYNGPQYGAQCKANDVIEMKVNFNSLSISFKVNNTDYGKAFDIVQESYRAAISFYYENTGVTLLSYQTQ